MPSYEQTSYLLKPLSDSKFRSFHSILAALDPKLGYHRNSFRVPSWITRWYRSSFITESILLPWIPQQHNGTWTTQNDAFHVDRKAGPFKLWWRQKSYWFVLVCCWIITFGNSWQWWFLLWFQDFHLIKIVISKVVIFIFNSQKILT